jgi:hypothetical protein
MLAQRLEIQCFEGALGSQFMGVVADKQLAIDEEHVRFDTGEAEFEGVEQRTLVVVVIVRMGAGERLGKLRGKADGPSCDESDEESDVSHTG